MIISIVGWSGSGKTTLISKLIAKLKKRGKSVNIIKHIAHKYSLQPQAKDSQIFLDSGADKVYLTTNKEVVCLERITDQDKLLDILQPAFDTAQLTLIEGNIGGKFPTIEVFDPLKQKKPKYPLNKLSALVLVAEGEYVTDIPIFNIKEIDRIIKFIEEYDSNGTKSNS